MQMLSALKKSILKLPVLTRFGPWIMISDKPWLRKSKLYFQKLTIFLRIAAKTARKYEILLHYCKFIQFWLDLTKNRVNNIRKNSRLHCNSEMNAESFFILNGSFGISSFVLPLLLAPIRKWVFCSLFDNQGHSLKNRE